MTLLVIMSILAVWRGTRMLQDDEGPFGVFARLQAKVASLPDKVGGINRGFYCFWCLSIWVSIPFALLLTHLDTYNAWYLVFVHILALSGAAVLMNAIFEHNNED